MEDARGGCGHHGWRGGPNLHGHACGAGGEDGEEDGVDVAITGRVGGLVLRVVADGAAV